MIMCNEYFIRDNPDFVAFVPFQFKDESVAISSTKVTEWSNDVVTCDYDLFITVQGPAIQ